METSAGETALDLESLFHAQYPRVQRIISRVIHDPARAEELAVDVFLKLPRATMGNTAGAEGWLYRVAVRMALDELRRQTRRGRYERLLSTLRGSPTPEEMHSSRQDHDNTRVVLSCLSRRQSELLLLRYEGLSYDELASALNLNATSVGTLLSRAQQAFRKEYVKRYGER